MINYNYDNISLKIAEYILDNSLFNIEKLTIDNGISKNLTDCLKYRIEDIDSGVCGIILFLIELIKIQPEERFIKAIQEGGDALLKHCKSTPRDHFGFYKGRGGVCYTLLEISKATKNKKFLDYALQLAKSGSDIFINSEFSTNRLYDGRSGLLLSLLHLYINSPEHWISEKIRHCVNKIGAEFVFTKEGLFWNRRESNINSLNSFFYGSSGVAFVMTQVSGFYDRTEMKSAISSIHMMEDLNWNFKLSYWPDYRNEIITTEDYKLHISKYKSKKFRFFTIPTKSFNIAIGTAGICLSRLAFLALENEIKLKNKITKGITTLLDFKTDDLSLSNGMSGIGSLLIESSVYLNNSSYFRKAIEIGNNLYTEELAFQNMSLLNGCTGIGYFFLQLLNPLGFQSVLFPVLKSDNPLPEKDVLMVSSSNFIMKCAQHNFPYTFKTLQTINPELYLSLIKRFKFRIYTNPIDLIEKFITSFSNLIPPEQKKVIADVFTLEVTKLQMFYKTKSFSLNHIRTAIKYEERVLLMNMDDQELLNQSLVFEKDIRLIKVYWDWSNLNQSRENITGIISEFLQTDAEKMTLLLSRNNENVIIEEKLDTLGQLTKRIFREPKLVHDAIHNYLESFDINSDSENDQIKDYAIQYIRYYIKQSLLYRQCV